MGLLIDCQMSNDSGAFFAIKEILNAYCCNLWLEPFPYLNHTENQALNNQLRAT